MPDRRHFIRQFVFAAAGLSLIPACMEDRKKASIILKNMKIGNAEEDLLAELSETILPLSSTPGAKDISAHLFALKMMDECHPKEDQTRFLAGLQKWEGRTLSLTGKHYMQLNKDDREKLLSSIESDRAADKELAYFYFTLKRLCIQAYTTSKYYLTQVHIYKLVPGPYRGCVPVAAA